MDPDFQFVNWKKLYQMSVPSRTRFGFCKTKRISMQPNSRLVELHSAYDMILLREHRLIRKRFFILKKDAAISSETSVILATSTVN
jgi:hypothetical protein